MTEHAIDIIVYETENNVIYDAFVYANEVTEQE